MVTQETLGASSICVDRNANADASPRTSFSAEVADGEEQGRTGAEFEFLSSSITNMITADELFSEGKLMTFWQIQQAEKLEKISLKAESHEKGFPESDQASKESRIGWFLDDDPSPRPPTCNVLWKELLRLKKQRPSTLSPSFSSSSSSRSPKPGCEAKDAAKNKEKTLKRSKKAALERTRSATIRIRPMINVPICTQRKNTALHHLLYSRKAKLER